MKILCVAEKPSIAKSITQILSSGSFRSREGRDKFCRNYDFQYKMPGRPGFVDFTVTAVRGHLTGSDFPDAYRKWADCDPADLFEAPVVTAVSKDMTNIARNLQSEARSAQMLMIWTDCDREGEHIGSEIVGECRKANRNIEVKRARFSAIIADQIHRACQNPVELDWRQAAAVEARISLDLRIGAAFTRMQTLMLTRRFPAELADKLISYGPCQFPTLGFVVDQYDRVENFVPETFWYISVSHDRRESREGERGPAGGALQSVEFRWRRSHLFDFGAALVLLERCVEEPEAVVRKVVSKQTKKWKPYPLTTVELQKTGSRLLRLAPKKVLDIAESLYQKGFVSYPRTETDQYDKDFDFQTLIEKQSADNDWGAFAARLNAGEYERPRNGKKNDKAHPPIHPTAHANNLSGDDRRVYELITRRFLASCSKDGIGRETSVEIEIAEETFSAHGLVILQRNYLDVFPYDTWSGTLLPDFQEGETFMPTACNLKEGKTSRPKLLTEADLVSLMDRNGIGTDATIAEHISKIIDRSYVMTQMEGRTKYLVPSTLGIGLVEGYNSINFDKSLTKPQLRREAEYRMGLVCAGERTKQETIDESVEEYREVYVKIKRDFDTLAESVGKYLRGEVGGQAGSRDPFEGDAQGATHGYGDDNDGPPTGGRGGREGRGGRGARGGATARRGAGAGRTTRRSPSDHSDNDSDDDRPAGGGMRVPARNRAPPNANANAKNGGQGLLCRCSEPAVERTVNKDGPNQGRKFWACPRPRDDGSCGFFEWADGVGGGAAGSGPSRARGPAVPAKRPVPDDSYGGYRRQLAVMEDNEPRRCTCELEAALKTVNKEGPNKGREFYVCPKESERARCNFFEWADEESRGPTRAAPAHNGGTSGKCFRCGEQGHWSSNCPNEEMDGASTSTSRAKRGRGTRPGRGGRGRGRGTSRDRGRKS